MDRSLLDIMTADLEATRRRLIREVSRAEALQALLSQAVELAERTTEPPTLDDLKRDAYDRGGEVELAKYRDRIAVIERTGQS